jgi:hypothetical protein
MERPGTTEYASFYAGYVGLVPEVDVLSVLEAQAGDLGRLLAGVTPDREGWAYAPGKWSIRQVVGHLGDAERVFGYRAFSISRGERQPLPGFDENPYVAAAGFDEWTLADLVGHFAGLRKANLETLRHVRPREWGQTGTASGAPVTVRALAFIMAGHVRHHSAVLRDRYGLKDS